MFPSVRLMVAAIFASIVVLVFGFGMFAAFRVSHEPFARLPPATSPLQLVADNTAVSPLAFAPREPFERRLQLGELPNFPPAADVPTLKADRHDEVEAAPAVASARPETDVPEAERTNSINEPKAQLASSSPQPGQEPTPQTVGSAENDHALDASAPQAASASTVIAIVSAAAPPPGTTSAQATGEATTGSAPAGEPALAASVLATVEQVPLAETAKPSDEIAPASAIAAGKHKSAKKTKHVRIAARIRRIRRVVSAALADTSQSFGQSTAFPQSSVQTAPQTAQLGLAQNRPVHVRRTKVASRPAKAPNSATGGPFVSPPKK
jgi:hypothetical protein